MPACTGDFLKPGGEDGFSHCGCPYPHVDNDYALCHVPEQAHKNGKGLIRSGVGPSPHHHSNTHSYLHFRIGWHLELR